MEKTVNILVVALMAAAGLQIVAVHFLYRSVNYSDVLKNVDLTALQTAFNVIPFLF